MKRFIRQFVNRYDLKTVLNALPVDRILCKLKEMTPKKGEFLWRNENAFIEIFETVIFKSFVILKLHFVTFDRLAVDSMDDLTKMTRIRLDKNAIFFYELGNGQ
jgi:hypothetical protein